MPQPPMFEPESDAPGETPFFTDDAATVSHILEKNWSLGKYRPTFTYGAEAMMTDALVGNVHVTQTSRYANCASCDSVSWQRQSFLAIRISSRSRDIFFAMGQEVYRICMLYRRAGPKLLKGYATLEITDDQQHDGLDGWYSGVIDIKMTYPYRHMTSGGFGPTGALDLP